MNTIVQHIWNEVKTENTEKLMPIFDTEIPIRSTFRLNHGILVNHVRLLGNHISLIVFMIVVGRQLKLILLKNLV